jgi:DNA-binding response OmpR family regulator
MTPGLTQVLIVEDDRLVRRFLADNLAADGYEPLEAGSLAQARSRLAAGCPGLLLLDLGLPDGDGLSLLSQLRDPQEALHSQVPAIVLSGRAGELDRVRGLERGADDYLPKPFSYPELRARIGAVLRRGQERPAAGRLVAGPLVIDTRSRGAWLQGQPVHLSQKEFELLRLLASAPTRTFTRDELLSQVWGYRSAGRTRTLDSHAHRVRRKLARSGVPLLINVWGVGYRLIDEEAVGA